MTTMTLPWAQIPCLFPEIWTWGLDLGAYQYVLGFNAETKLWSLSAKLIGEDPERERIDLGFEFTSCAAAEEACRMHAEYSTAGHA